ncbi:unnamed protein product [Tilletia controversa]|uniref:Gfd2/YDR514C-like C-terminal domain-containing protein n=1 Tax=Tilletia controversa TaxID=13291 RepID=A0A8X7MS19_9BASI|nr:hypothetical protein CF328_g3882 [Tilletia controversa]KAE8247270.1 hypothetical protein A4X06_0g4573 [Tilletia controversa]CAD6910223.1 unnamed protein product [Tilletia controversa]CAD6916338.1 unnamed protein product [Tilletia controversa]CAD6968638.1 unnamed protein product [Tilletia controversa]
MSSRYDHHDRNTKSWRPQQQRSSQWSQSRESSTASFRTADTSFQSQQPQQPPYDRRYDARRSVDRPDVKPKPEPAPQTQLPNDPLSASARPPWQLELDTIATALKDRTANFLSVQAVPWDHGPHEIIEFGWSYPDPKRPHAPLEEALITMHYIPISGIKRRNGMLSANARESFLFGDHSLDIKPTDTDWNAAKTQRLDFQEIVDRLEETIQMLLRDKRPLYLVVHGDNRGLEALTQAALNTIEWGRTAFGPIETDDHIALDMNMDLSELNAIHQQARLAKDAERAAAEKREWEDKIKKLKNPDNDGGRGRDPYAHPELSSRFNPQATHGTGRGSDSRGNQTASYSNAPGPSRQPANSGSNNSSRARGRDDDDDDDAYDEWGFPISDDEDGFGIPCGTASGSRAPMFKKNLDIKVLDTTTLMKALGYMWYEPDPNPTAKAPEDPKVRDMCRVILKGSPYARKLRTQIFDNAGNDAHYTMLSLAEMIRQWFENQRGQEQAAAAVPDMPRTIQGVVRDDRALRRFDSDGSKLDSGTPAPQSAVPAKHENADAGPSRPKKKPKPANPMNSLETLIAEYECLRNIWQANERGEKAVAFVAIDIETFEQDHNYTLEVGWSILYPPSKFTIDLSHTRDGIVASHFIIDEHRAHRNGNYVANNRDHFLLGSANSEKIDGCEQLMNKSCLAPEPDIWKKLSKKLKQFAKHVDEIYLVFHDATGDIPVLEQWEVLKDVEVLPFFDANTGKHRVPPPTRSPSDARPQAKKDSKARRPIWLVDTQRLMRAYQHSKDVTSIKTMCEELVLHPAVSNKRLHNAGNDAFYTLFGMKVMASGPELPELRKKKQEERKALPSGPRRAVVLQSWDQEFIERDLPEAKEELTPAQIIQQELSNTPGSQERLRPLFNLCDSWYDQQCAFIAIRSVVVDGQIVEMAWSVIDRRSLGTQLEGQAASSSANTLDQPQRTYHYLDIDKINLLTSTGAHRFHAPFGAVQRDEDQEVVKAQNSGAEVLPNGTVATTLLRMASQMRALITKLRKTPGKIYFVFHGPVKNHQFPELRIPNEQLPEELHSHGRAATHHALAVDDDDDDEEKLADIEIIDSALVFERYIEKADSVTNADATMLEDTRPSLEDMCQEFNLCAGEQIVTDNAGNAAHLILRAVAYMSTRNPIHHANGGPAADNPQDKIARLRALATTLLPTS